MAEIAQEILSVSLEDEMQQPDLDYAMRVIDRKSVEWGKSEELGGRWMIKK